MKRFLWAILFVLLLWIPSLATDLQIQSQVVPDWHDTRTSASNPPHLRIFASEAFWTSAGIAVPAGNPSNGKFYKDVACSQSGTTVTIPAFVLASTTDASAGTQASRYTFYWYTASGAQISTTPFLADAQVPPSIVSISGCTPIGTCATFADLSLYNSPSPPLPTPTYPTTDQVSQMIIANLSIAAGAPSSGSYITKTPVGALVNSQALSPLATGILKSTTGTGVLSIAVAETDFSRALTFVAPLIRSVDSISIPVANGSTNGYLSSTDWTTFNNKQIALGFTPENVANKDTTYAGLTGGKVLLSKISEVISIGDLLDATDALGTGTTVPKGTFAGIGTNDSIRWNGTNFVPFTPATVTSVAATVPSGFSISGSPITTSGTLAISYTAGQAANSFLATPDGTTGALSLRTIVNGDLPIVNATHGGSGLNFLPSANHFLRVNGAGAAYEETAFVQGTNITIAHGSGTVTISAAGAANHNLLSTTHPDTTPGTIVRGDLVVGQGSGTATWQRLAIGTAGKALVTDGTDATWGQVSLTAGVTGILPAANGGTGINGATAANGNILIGNGAGYTLAPITAGSNISIVNSAGGIQISASGVLGVAWHNITDPVALNLSLAMGATTTTFTWGNATGGGVDMYTIRDSASNSGTGHVLAINTAASSAAKPFGFFAQGTSNGIEMSTTGQVTATGTGSIVGTSLNGIAGNGYIVRTSAGNFTARSFVDGVGITWTNPDGVAGAGSAAWNPATFVADIVTWNAANATRTWTANLNGATDPVWTYGNNSADLSTGVLKQGGTAVVLQSFTLTGGTGISAIGDLSTNRTVSVDQSFSPTWTGIHIWTPTARTSGSAAYFTVNIPADTGITASTESIGIKLGVTNTRTWATGALITNREIVAAAPTYAFAGSSTLTNAATFAITGAPIAGSNATITNKYALWVQSGVSEFSGGVQDKAGQVFNVLSYGAKPDGTTDSVQAFRDAITACKNAGGGVVLVPQGTAKYKFATGLVIGDGSLTNFSTYGGVKLVGVGGTWNSGMNSPTVIIEWSGSAGGTMLTFAGPISGCAVEGIYLDCVGANSAAIGIQAMHADGLLIRNVGIEGATSVGLDIDAYDKTSFLPGPVTGVLAQDGDVENTYISGIGVNNCTLVRVGHNGSISGWNFKGGRWRADGTTGSTAVELAFADHNNYWGLTGKAEVGVRIKPGRSFTATGTGDPDGTTTLLGSGTAFLTELAALDLITVNGETRTVSTVTDNTHVVVTVAFTNTAGGAAITVVRPHAGFPVNNPFFFSSMNGSSAANAYVVDTTLTSYAPSAGYGSPFFGLPTIDSGSATTPFTTANLYGWDDQQRFFGSNAWSFTRGTTIAISTLQGALQLGLKGGTQNVGSGAGILFFGDDSGGNKEFMGRIGPTWVNKTDASETADMVIQIRGSAGDTGAATEVARFSEVGKLNLTSITGESGMRITANSTSAARIDLYTTSTADTAIRNYCWRPDNVAFGDFALYKSATRGGDALSVGATTNAILYFNPAAVASFTKGADVADAATITATGNTFTITGSGTTIATITSTNIMPGTVLNMITTNAITFSETGNITVQGAGTTLVTVANDVVIGVWDGSKWRIR